MVQPWQMHNAYRKMHNAYNAYNENYYAKSIFVATIFGWFFLYFFLFIRVILVILIIQRHFSLFSHFNHKTTWIPGKFPTLKIHKFNYDRNEPVNIEQRTLKTVQIWYSIFHIPLLLLLLTILPFYCWTNNKRINSKYKISMNQ